MKEDVKPLNLNSMTKRQIFSLCGKLFGHYPVAGWLRVTLSFVKRGSQGNAWDSFADHAAIERLKEVLTRLKADDPVKGVWSVPPTGVTNIWCDASKIAYGVALERGDEIIEDEAWLRKTDDGTHINLAELNAVIKGVNLSMKWGAKNVAIMTDSAAVHLRMLSMLKRDKRIRVSGLSETLVKRRLSILLETLEAYGAQWGVFLVSTTKNKADVLTRVPRHWLRKCTSDPADTVAVSQSCLENQDLVEHSHGLHHCSVDTTLYFATQIDPNVGRDEVDGVVKNCRECQSIDPSSTRIDCGELSVPDDWQRVAVDVTYYGLQKYLTMVDCGPSRFAIWRIIRSESETEVVSILRQVFSQFGPPTKILCDNGRSFTSKLMRDFCEFWVVQLAFRCAYKPSGNGIVESNHRTIKRMSTRSGRSVEYSVFWYNVTPHCDQRIISSRKLISDKCRNPFLERSTGMKTVDDHERTSSEFVVGDEVWVKPPGARCSTPWKSGVVTGVNFKYNVEIDRVPRHVRNIRRRLANNFDERGEQGVVSEPPPSNNPDFRMESSEPSKDGVGTDEDASTSCVRRVARKRQLPDRFNDFFL